ncbi:GFA family protein [Paraburkholderia rhizosphaerae]|uniref:CENP-V/GFA domain-containing protein n=1 Tax=Paraburkholderia rhizosphaerae TaxID=480658 RepID=A0A4R8LI78_9BURK|nr:GFA family protein [Paraburkholderia rhizosphaerae]TDY42510.1 hypothetical protein BX592_12181 [Paraburkholderia rhizosphaerae]
MESLPEAHPQEDIYEGGCACGALRFRAQGVPKRVGLCHCMTCRRIHGSAFGSYAIYEHDDVEWSGATQAWLSSELGRRHFCPVCGSVAYMEYGDRSEIDMPLGAFDQTGIFEPTYELYCCRKEPWLPRGVRTEFDMDRD